MAKTPKALDKLARRSQHDPDMRQHARPAILGYKLGLISTARLARLSGQEPANLDFRLQLLATTLGKSRQLGKIQQSWISDYSQLGFKAEHNRRHVGVESLGASVNVIRM